MGLLNLIGIGSTSSNNNKTGGISSLSGAFLGNGKTGYVTTGTVQQQSSLLDMLNPMNLIQNSVQQTTNAVTDTVKQTTSTVTQSAGEILQQTAQTAVSTLSSTTSDVFSSLLSNPYILIGGIVLLLVLLK